jgi:membrane protease YdiL (CAAX protease family)
MLFVAAAPHLVFGLSGISPLAGLSGLALVCCFGAVFVAASIVTALISATGYDPPTVRDSGVDLTAAYVLAAIAISITAGVAEETVYRGYAITRMEQAGWPRAALFVPLLVWAGEHLYEGVFAIFIVGSVGVPLVWLFWWKRTVWPLMIAHALYDVAIFLLAASL